MTPKEYLAQIGDLNAKINQRLAERDELKSMMYQLGGGGSSERVQTSAKNEAPFVRLVERLETLENEISSLVDNYVDKKTTIIEQIQSMENKNYMNLLYKRYVEGKRLELIAVEMNYSYLYTRQMHGKALLDFGKKFLKDVTQSHI